MFGEAEEISQYTGAGTSHVADSEGRSGLRNLMPWPANSD